MLQIFLFVTSALQPPTHDMKNFLIATALLAAPLSQAAMIAHYDFSDGNLLDNEVSASYNLTQGGSGFGTGITLNGDGSAHIDGGGNNNTNFLKASGIGAGTGSDFTISMWFKTDTTNPTTHSSFASGGSGTWQVEHYVSALRVNTDTPITTSTSLSADTWYQAVVWTDGTDSKLFMSEEGGALTEVGSASNNALTLNDLSIGINRGGNLTWQGDYANIQVYDEALDNATITTILDAGSGVASVPEPSAVSLLGLGGLALILRRKK